MSIAPFYEKTAVMTTDDPEMQTKNDFIGTGDAIKSTAADISTVLDEKLNEFGQKLQPTVNKVRMIFCVTMALRFWQMQFVYR